MRKQIDTFYWVGQEVFDHHLATYTTLARIAGYRLEINAEGQITLWKGGVPKVKDKFLAEVWQYLEHTLFFVETKQKPMVTVWIEDTVPVENFLFTKNDLSVQSTYIRQKRGAIHCVYAEIPVSRVSELLAYCQENNLFFEVFGKATLLDLDAWCRALEN